MGLLLYLFYADRSLAAVCSSRPPVFETTLTIRAATFIDNIVYFCGRRFARAVAIYNTVDDGRVEINVVGRGREGCGVRGGHRLCRDGVRFR